VGDFTLQLLALLVVIFGLRSNRLIEFVRNLGGIGRGPGGPQHPLPISNPIEANRHKDA
jgi:hypothetical protein